jgi:hypothetical protein
MLKISRLNNWKGDGNSQDKSDVSEESVTSRGQHFRNVLEVVLGDELVDKKSDFVMRNRVYESECRYKE